MPAAECDQPFLLGVSREDASGATNWKQVRGMPQFRIYEWIARIGSIVGMLGILKMLYTPEWREMPWSARGWGHIGIALVVVSVLFALKGIDKAVKECSVEAPKQP